LAGAWVHYSRFTTETLMALTLIHSPRSRSFSFVWLLEELDTPYEIKTVTIRRGDGSGALDPANPHPHGKVPAILDNGVLIHEQSAIALYLTDRFPASGLGPQVDDPGRGPYLTWLAYYSGVVEPSFTSKFLNVPVPRGTAGWVEVDETMAHIVSTLANHAYLLGDRFSAADILFGGAFNLFADSPFLPKSQVIADYAQRCVSRPAFAKAAAKDG
jgi:glutathione S-transferase